MSHSPALDLSAPPAAGSAVYHLPNLWQIQSHVQRGLHYAVMEGHTVVETKSLGRPPEDGGELGRWQVQAVKAFATDVVEDVLGQSPTAQPYVRRTVASLFAPMLGHEAGAVTIARADLVEHIRTVNLTCHRSSTPPSAFATRPRRASEATSCMW